MEHDEEGANSQATPEANRAESGFPGMTAAEGTSSGNSPQQKKPRRWTKITPTRRQMIQEFRSIPNGNNGVIGSEVWKIKLFEYIQTRDAPVSKNDVFRWIENDSSLIRALGEDEPEPILAVARKSATSTRMTSNETKKMKASVKAMSAAAAKKAEMPALLPEFVPNPPSLMSPRMAANEAIRQAKAMAMASGSAQIPALVPYSGSPISPRVATNQGKNQAEAQNTAQPMETGNAEMEITHSPTPRRKQTFPKRRKLEDDYEIIVPVPEIPVYSPRPAAPALNFSGFFGQDNGNESLTLMKASMSPRPSRPRAIPKKFLDGAPSLPKKPQRQQPSRGKKIIEKPPAEKAPIEPRRGKKRIAEKSFTVPNPLNNNALESQPQTAVKLEPSAGEGLMVAITDYTKYSKTPEEFNVDVDPLGLANHNDPVRDSAFVFSPPGSPPSAECNNLETLAGIIRSSYVSDGGMDGRLENWAGDLSQSNSNFNMFVKTEVLDLPAIPDLDNAGGHMEMETSFGADNANALSTAAPTAGHMATSYSVEGEGFPPNLTYVSSGYQPTPAIPIDLTKFPVVTPTQTQQGGDDNNQTQNQVISRPWENAGAPTGSLMARDPDPMLGGQMEKYPSPQPIIQSPPPENGNYYQGENIVSGYGNGTMNLNQSLSTANIPGPSNANHNHVVQRPVPIPGNSFAYGNQQSYGYSSNDVKPSYAFDSVQRNMYQQQFLQDKYPNNNVPLPFNGLLDINECLNGMVNGYGRYLNPSSAMPSTSGYYQLQQQQGPYVPPPPPPSPARPSPVRPSPTRPSPGRQVVLGEMDIHKMIETLRRLLRIFTKTPALSTCILSCQHILRELEKMRRSALGLGRPVQAHQNQTHQGDGQQMVSYDPQNPYGGQQGGGGSSVCSDEPEIIEID